MSTRKLYKISFLSAGRIYELYARKVTSSELWGFTEVSELVFDVGEGVVIDPTEERLRDEFGASKRLHLPMQSILRIEEVERRCGHPRVIDVVHIEADALLERGLERTVVERAPGLLQGAGQRGCIQPGRRLARGFQQRRGTGLVRPRFEIAGVQRRPRLG